MQAMHDVAARCKRTRLTASLKIILERLGAGKPLGDAMQGCLDASALALVAAGEAGGDLERACKDAADLLVKRKEMRTYVIKGLTVPAIKIALLTALVYFIAVQIVPAAGGQLQPEQMGALAQAYFAFGNWFVEWGAPTLLSLIAIALLIVSTFAGWTGPLRARLDSLLPWDIYRHAKSGSVLIALDSMMRAGTPFAQAIESEAKHSSPWARERLLACRANLADGKNDAQSLADSALLPPEIGYRLSAYARMPIAQMMLPLSDDAVNRAKQMVGVVSSVVMFYAVVAMATFLIFA